MNKRILIIGPYLSLIGGVATFNKLLINKFPKLKQKYIIKYQPCGRKKKDNNKLIIIIRYIFNFFEFLKNLRNFRPSLIHLNPSIETVSLIRDGICLRISKNRGIKVLFFLHGWDNKYFEDHVKHGFFSNFHKKTLQMTDGIVVLSPEFKQELISIGINQDKIHILTTMVEVDKYDPGEKDFSPPYRLLFCGRLVKEKGVYEAIKAIKYIVKDFPSTTLTIMGDGPELNNLKIFAEKIGVKGNIIFTGFLTGNRKYEVFKKAHIFVYPSYKEGFPNVALEAMAAGLPIIATPVGGLKYAIKNGVNGYLLNSIPPDPKEIAHHLSILLNNSDLMLKISRNNRNTAEKKYSVENVLQKLIGIYNDIITK